MEKRTIYKALEVNSTKARNINSSLIKYGLINKGSIIANGEDVVLFSFSMLICPPNFYQAQKYIEQMKLNLATYLKSFNDLLNGKQEVGIYANEMIVLISSKSEIIEIENLLLNPKGKSRLIRTKEIQSIKSLFSPETFQHDETK
jgi:hypothetical protein